MLFKDLKNVLVTVECYTIRIDIFDTETKTTIKTNIYGMKEIPDIYDNLKVLTIHSNGSYDSNLYQYFITLK